MKRTECQICRSINFKDYPFCFTCGGNLSPELYFNSVIESDESLVLSASGYPSFNITDCFDINFNDSFSSGISTYVYLGTTSTSNASQVFQFYSDSFLTDVLSTIEIVT